MNSKIPTSTFSVVYYASNIRFLQSWELSPFYHALRQALCGESFVYPEHLRRQQHYHFLGKIVLDEEARNGSEIRQNLKHVSKKLTLYQKNKSTQLATELNNIYFYCWLLNLLDRNLHYENLNHKALREIVKQTDLQDSITRRQNEILKLFFWGIQRYETKETDDLVESSLDLLYSRVRLAKNELKESPARLDYYVLQSRVENISTKSINANDPKIFEAALILKVVTQNGLFIPESEKDEYLSIQMKSLVFDKYLAILRSSFRFKLFKLRLPIWILPIIIFLVQFLLFQFPEYIEGVEPFGVSIKLQNFNQFVKSIPLYAILAFNAILFAVLTIIFQNILIRKRIIREL